LAKCADKGLWNYYIMKLVVLSGPDKGSEFELHGRTLTIGRGEECAIVLTDKYASKLQLEIQKSAPNTWTAHDIASGKGFKVNRKKVTEHILAPGDKLTFGRTVLGVAESNPPPKQYSDRALQKRAIKKKARPKADPKLETIDKKIGSIIDESTDTHDSRATFANVKPEQVKALIKKQVAKRRKKINALLKEAREAIKQRKDAMRTRIAEEIKRLNEEFTHKRSKFKEIQRDLDERTASLDKRIAFVEEREAALDDRQASRDRSEIEELQRFKEEIEVRNALLAEREQSLGALSDDKEKLQQLNAELQSRIDEFAEREKQWLLNETEFEQRFTEADARIKQAEQSRENSEITKLESLRQELKTQDSELSERSQKLSEKERELERRLDEAERKLGDATETLSRSEYAEREKQKFDTTSISELDDKRKNRAPTFVGIEFLIIFTLIVFNSLIFTSGRIAAYGLANDLKLFFLPRLLWSVKFVQTYFRVPLWDPFTFSGLPFVGNMQSPVYYPPNWMSLVMAPWRFFNLYFVAHSLGAGLAAYALARRMKLSEAASAVCALAYQASGFYIAHLYAGHAGHLGNYPWLPLQLLAAWELVRTRKARWAVGLAAFGAIQFISGHPQFFMYSMTFVAAFTIVVWFAEGRRELVKMVFMLLLALALLVGFSAFWLLPGLEFRNLMPNPGRAPLEYATAYSMTVSDVARLAFGRRSAFLTTNLPTFWETCGYAGMITLVLAGAGAWLGRKKALTLFLAVAAILTVLFSMGREGGVFYFFYYVVPGYSGFRAPSRMLMVYTIAVALLAGFGLDAFLRLGASRAKSGLILVGCAVAAAVALFLAMRFLRDLDGAWADAFWAFRRPPAIIAAIATVLGLLAVAFRIPAAGWVVLVALAVDLGSFAMPLIKTVPYGDLLWSSKMVDKLAAEEKPFRITMPRPDNRLTKAQLAENWIEATQLSHDASGLAHFDQLMVGKRGSLHKKRNAHYCRLLNIKYLISRGAMDAPGFEKVMEEKPPNAGMPNVLYRFKDYHSRAFLVGQTLWLPGSQPGYEGKRVTLKKSLEEIDLMESAYVEETAAIFGTGPWHKEAEIKDYKVDEFYVEVETEKSAYLVISQIWHPGWKIMNGSLECPVYRTDGALLGTPLAAGKYRLKVFYNPKSIHIGRWITAITVLLTIVVSIIRPLARKQIQKRHRRNEEEFDLFEK